MKAKVIDTESVELPETLQEAIIYFANEQRAFEFFVTIRWPDGVVRCPDPECKSDAVTFMTNVRRWKCRACRGQFSVKVGTIFEQSPLPLSKWIPALWVIVNAKNGVSSCELARSLGVTQKTAWFMLRRLRLAMEGGSIIREKMKGKVEADETFVGGKSEFMHKGRKRRLGITPGNGMAAKTAVQGVLERASDERPVSKVFATVLPAMPTKKAAMKALTENVEKGSEVHTDIAAIYQDVQRDYIHKTVDHAQAFVIDNIHTNGLENFWSLLKRALKGTYVSVEPCHLFRYVAEQVFRFNERKDERGDLGRFLSAINYVVGRRLTYRQLIGADLKGGDGLPA